MTLPLILMLQEAADTAASAATSAPASSATSAAASAAATSAAYGSSAWLAAALILLVVGLGIAALELFIPSAGALGLAAGTALVASLVCLFYYNTAWGFAGLALYAAGAPIALLVGLKLWTHTPLAQRLVLGGTDDEESTAAPAPADVQAAAQLVGRRGTALTTMRPVGFIRVDQQRMEAHAESGMIEPGTAVQIVECTGTRVVVRPVR
ncbi:MAG: NfeD family protein [Phycisphaerales bacterium]